MKCTLALSLLISTVACLGPGRALADSGVYSCPGADGSVELVGQPTGPNCEQLASAPEPTPMPAGSAAPPATPAGGQAAAAAPNKTAGAVADEQAGEVPLDSRLAAYRDAMIQKANGAAPDGQQPMAPTSAAGRRYLMVDRATYMQTFGGGQR